MLFRSSLAPTDLIAAIEVDTALTSPRVFPIRVLVPPEVGVRTTADPALVTARPTGRPTPAGERR